MLENVTNVLTKKLKRQKNCKFILNLLFSCCFPNCVIKCYKFVIIKTKIFRVTKLFRIILLRYPGQQNMASALFIMASTLSFECLFKDIPLLGLS